MLPRVGQLARVLRYERPVHSLVRPGEGLLDFEQEPVQCRGVVLGLRSDQRSSLCCSRLVMS